MPWLLDTVIATGCHHSRPPVRAPSGAGGAGGAGADARADSLAVSPELSLEQMTDERHSRSSGRSIELLQAQQN